MKKILKNNMLGKRQAIPDGYVKVFQMTVG